MPTNVELNTLLTQLQTAGLPAITVEARSGQVVVWCSTALSPSQDTQLTTAVAAWDPRLPMRALYQIYNDLAALTTTQQGNAWTDLSSGTPAKYLLDAGPNAAAIAVMDWVVKKSGAAGAALTDARLRIAAMYVQDNASYLVTPAFDPTINVPGKT